MILARKERFRPEVTVCAGERRLRGRLDERTAGRDCAELHCVRATAEDFSISYPFVFEKPGYYMFVINQTWLQPTVVSSLSKIAQAYTEPSRIPRRGYVKHHY
jgi:hypothetical protein